MKKEELSYRPNGNNHIPEQEGAALVPGFTAPIIISSCLPLWIRRKAGENFQLCGWMPFEHPTHLSIRKIPCYHTPMSANADTFCSFDKWVANPTVHLHCNKLHANALSDRSRTVGIIFLS